MIPSLRPALWGFPEFRIRFPAAAQRPSSICICKGKDEEEKGKREEMGKERDLA